MPDMKKLLSRPETFRRLTGLSPRKFSELAAQVTPLFLEADRKRKDRPGRKRAVGGGPKRKLSVEQALFGLLLYYRTYVNHIFIGIVLGIDDSNVCRYFRQMEPLLAGIFRIPERKIRMSEDEILELIVDATEQEAQKRPGSGYSGKKKRQTVKTQAVVSPDGKIMAVSKSVPGNMHDKRLWDLTRAFAGKRAKWKADLAYLGTRCKIPHKKPKGGALTEKQGEENKKHAAGRIVVEHVFAHMKKFGILSQRYRGNVRRYNLVFRNVAGIRNLQIA